MSDADPALVAAGSTAAEALIAASSPVGGPAAVAAPPSGGPPNLATGAATDANSRYAASGTAVHRDREGRETVHLRRRLIPAADRLATLRVELVQPGDRVDLLAARALGDPTLFWQLCDANSAFDPSELEVAGSRVRVALPEGFPGVNP